LSFDVTTEKVFTQLRSNTPNVAFRHHPLRRDVVNQCMEFAKERLGPLRMIVSPLVKKSCAVD